MKKEIGTQVGEVKGCEFAEQTGSNPTSLNKKGATLNCANVLLAVAFADIPIGFGYLLISGLLAVLCFPFLSFCKEPFRETWKKNNKDSMDYMILFICIFLTVGAGCSSVAALVYSVLCFGGIVEY